MSTDPRCTRTGVHAMHQLDGAWYCSGMTQKLLDALEAQSSASPVSVPTEQPEQEPCMRCGNDGGSPCPSCAADLIEAEGTYASSEPDYLKMTAEQPEQEALRLAFQAGENYANGLEQGYDEPDENAYLASVRSASPSGTETVPTQLLDALQHAGCSSGRQWHSAACSALDEWRREQ